MKKPEKFLSKTENNMPGQPPEDQIEKAIAVLKNGGIVIFPTDTVYGIGCRFDIQAAVNRIYQIKGTAKSQPFPILVSSIKQVERIANINPQAKELMSKFWPGGLTIILSPRHPELVSGSHQKVGFRMPDSSLVRSLIEGVGVPVIGTSANFHGSNVPKSFKELDSGLIKLADFVVEGKCKQGIESTVVDATINPPKILRQGAVKLTE